MSLIETSASETTRKFILFDINGTSEQTLAPFLRYGLTLLYLSLKVEVKVVEKIWVD